MADEPKKPPPWAKFHTKPGIIRVSLDGKKRKKSPFHSPDDYNLGATNIKNVRKDS